MKHQIRLTAALLSVGLAQVTAPSLVAFADSDKDAEKNPSKPAHEEKEEKKEDEEGARVGPGKAITTADRHQGIQLSDKAIKTLGLSGLKISSQGVHTVPARSLVYFQDEVGVYRLRNGWYKLVEIPAPEKKLSGAELVTIRTEELQPGDQVIQTGVPLLRVAELEAWGGSGDGHGH